jgi:hemoglobin/transferrin/lactoferrin receptor protein
LNRYFLALVMLTMTAAASPPESPETATTEPLFQGYKTVVTPKRGPTKAFDVDRVLFRAGAEAFSEQQPQDGPEVIGTLPGVMLQRTNRGAGSPVLRGLIGPRNLILVDGVRVNLSTFRTGPNQYASLVDPMALESIEVLLGPGSVLYGSDAIGGVIHYRTRALPSRDGFGGQVIYRGASADLSSEFGLQMEGREGSLSGWVGGSFRNHSVLRAGGGEEVPRSGFTQGDWRAKARMSLGNRQDVTIGYLGTQLSGATRIDKVNTGDLRVYGNTDHLAYLKATKRWMGDGLKRLRATVSFHQIVDVVDRNSCDLGDDIVTGRAACLADDAAVITRRRKYEDNVNATAVSLLTDARWHGGRVKATLGVDARHEMISSRLDDARASDGFNVVAAERGNFSEGSTYSTTDAFLTLEGRPWLSPGDTELVVRGGARWSRIQAFAPDVPNIGDVIYSAEAPVLDAGARFLVSNSLALFTSWSQGFRAPNLQETTALGNSGKNFEIPNEALGPERSTTREVGARYMRRNVYLSVSWFVTDIDEAITRIDALYEGESTYDGAPVQQRVNADAAHYEGYEFSLRTGDWRGLSGFGQLSWIRGEVSPSEKNAETLPANRVPPLMGSAGLRWRGGSRSLALSAWVEGASAQTELGPGDQTDLRICEDPSALGTTLGEACAGSEAWTTLNASMSFKPTPYLRTALSIKNVLDTRYRNHGSGFDSPGLDARLTADFQF